MKNVILNRDRICSIRSVNLNNSCKPVLTGLQKVEMAGVILLLGIAQAEGIVNEKISKNLLKLLSEIHNIENNE